MGHRQKNYHIVQRWHVKFKNIFESCVVLRNQSLLQGLFVERVDEWKKKVSLHKMEFKNFYVCGFFRSTVNIQNMTSLGLLTFWKSQSWSEYKLSGNWTTIKNLSETNKRTGNGVISYYRQKKLAFLVPIDEFPKISAALKFKSKKLRGVSF